MQLFIAEKPSLAQALQTQSETENAVTVVSILTKKTLLFHGLSVTFSKILTRRLRCKFEKVVLENSAHRSA